MAAEGARHHWLRSHRRTRTYPSCRTPSPPPPTRARSPIPRNVLPGTQLGGVPMRRNGWGIGAEPRPAAEAARVRPAAGLGIDLTGAMNSALHRTIPLSLSDMSEESVDTGDNRFERNDDEEFITYPFHPPGLITPPSLLHPVAEQASSTQVRRVIAMTPPGAPLLRSIPHFGSHHHDPGLDNRAGDIADEDALIARLTLTPARPTRPRHTRMLSSRGVPTLSRLANFHQ
ncbi:hypothetical protein C8Q74DRAFT_49411 [Fomes fomentarius]|nr:hypothetical protein C8Q74DRAFT_49411 [Fomes fomentarius]